MKQYSNKGLDVRSRFCYYRDNNGCEIDLLIVENGMVYPVEIKKSASPDKDALKNFKVLPSLHVASGQGAVICLSPFVYPLDENNKAVPVGVL